MQMCRSADVATGNCRGNLQRKSADVMVICSVSDLFRNFNFGAHRCGALLVSTGEVDRSHAYFYGVLIFI